MSSEWNLATSFLKKKVIESPASDASPSKGGMSFPVEGKIHVALFPIKERRTLEVKEERPSLPKKVETCDFCGGHVFRQNDRGQRDKVCTSCGTVGEGMPFEFNEKRAFDAEQIKNRKTHSVTSNLMYDKNLGSQIGVSKKYYGDYNVFRLINAERKLAMTLQHRELKEVIRIVGILADSNNLGIDSNDFEDLVISYRKKFLGTGLAVGRLRQMVITAFVFLELRAKNRYKHLTYDQYKKMISLPESMERALKKSISYLIKQHGYKLYQSTLEKSIENVMLSLNIEPIYISSAKDIASKIKTYYLYNSRKNAGIVAAIIYIVLKQTEKYKKITQEEVTKMVNGVKSIITVRKRISEIRSFFGTDRGVAIHGSSIGLKASATKVFNNDCVEIADHPMEVEEKVSLEEIRALNVEIDNSGGESGTWASKDLLSARGTISLGERKSLGTIISGIPTEEVKKRWSDALAASKSWSDMAGTISTVARFKNKKVKQSFEEYFNGEYGSVSRTEYERIKKGLKRDPSS